MSLTLIIGRPNAGKTSPLHAALNEALAQGASPVLLLPSEPDVERAVSEFAGKRTVGIQATTIDSWVCAQWSLYGDGRSIVAGCARPLLMSEAVSRVRMEALSSASEKPGFLGVMAGIASRAAPFALRAARQPMDVEIEAVLREYRAHLDAAGLIEATEATVLLGGLPRLAPRVIALNRFTDLSPAQESLVVALAADAEVILALPYEPGHAGTEALGEQVQRLVEQGALVRQVAATEPRTELDSLEREVFRAVTPVIPSGAVVLAEAAGAEAEITLAVRLAGRAIADGYSPERVAIVFREAGKRAAALSAAMAAEGLPLSLDVSVRFADTGFGRATVVLLDACCASDPRREGLLAFLQSPYSGADPEAVRRLDLVWRRKRPEGRALLSSAQTLGPVVAGALQLARHVCSAGLDESTVVKWGELASSLLQAAYARRGLEGYEGLVDAGAHRALLRVVADLSGLGGWTASGRGVVSALAAAPVTVSSHVSGSGVLLTEAHRVRARRFDVVILGGLSAAEFSSERPEPLESEMLRRLGVPHGVEERLSERLLFYMVATRARHRLCLLRQSSDVKGGAIRPSAFWEEVCDAYATTPVTGSGPCPLPIERLGLVDLAQAAPSFLRGRREERAEGVSPLQSRPRRGELADEIAGRLAVPREYTVSELETYLRCPYQWFIGRAVRPHAIDAEFGAREKGMYTHEVLASFYKRWHELEHGWRVSPGLLSEAIDLLDEIAAHAADGAHAVGLAEELSLATAHEQARNLLVDDVSFLPGFEPRYHEFAFGLGEGRPVRLNGVDLKGRIDRIDVGADGLVVVDYKNGSDLKGHKSIHTSMQLQVVAYGAAARRCLGRPILGAVYRSLKSLATRGAWVVGEVDLCGHGKAVDALEPEAFEAVLEDVGDLLSRAAAGIQAGRVVREPHHSGACGFCPVRGVCEEARG